MGSSGKKTQISDIYHSFVRKLRSANSIFSLRVWVTLGVRGYSCFVRVCVCTCLPGYDIKSEKIEINWSGIIHDQ